NAQVEGRSLLRALVTEAVARAEQVLVLLLEVPKEQFLEGLSPDVAERSVRGFGGKFGILEGFGGDLGKILWILWRFGAVLSHFGPIFDHIFTNFLPFFCLPSPPPDPPPRILALLHQDLHPPALLGALGGLARAQLVLEGRPSPSSPTVPGGLPPSPSPPRLWGTPKNPKICPIWGSPPSPFAWGCRGPSGGRGRPWTCPTCT
ncbi:hypothetical protein HGM15179_020601, partial [Zosterops borbonicus]